MRFFLPSFVKEGPGEVLRSATTPSIARKKKEEERTPLTSPLTKGGSTRRSLFRNDVRHRSRTCARCADMPTQAWDMPHKTCRHIGMPHQGGALAPNKMDVLMTGRASFRRIGLTVPPCELGRRIPVASGPRNRYDRAGAEESNRDKDASAMRCSRPREGSRGLEDGK